MHRTPQDIESIWKFLWCTWWWKLPEQSNLKSLSIPGTQKLFSELVAAHAPLCLPHNTWPLPAGAFESLVPPLLLVFKSWGMWSTNTTISLKNENPCIYIIFITWKMTDRKEETNCPTPLIKMEDLQAQALRGGRRHKEILSTHVAVFQTSVLIISTWKLEWKCS